MHEYGIDAKRTKIFFYLSLFAILCASAASHLLHDLPFATITIPVTSFTIFFTVVTHFFFCLMETQTLAHARYCKNT